jgi:hypothetical protein
MFALFIFGLLGLGVQPGHASIQAPDKSLNDPVDVPKHQPGAVATHGPHRSATHTLHRRSDIDDGPSANEYLLPPHPSPS